MDIFSSSFCKTLNKKANTNPLLIINVLTEMIILRNTCFYKDYLLISNTVMYIYIFISRLMIGFGDLILKFPLILAVSVFMISLNSMLS